MTSPSAWVTGGSGFIGRALTRRLAETGWQVTHIARGQSALPAEATAIRVDRFTRAPLLEATQGRRCDVLFHLAAYGVAPGDRDLDTMFEVNVAGTAAVVGAACAAGARAIVYTGSCAEYDEAKPGEPIDESHPATTPPPYGASKAAGGLWGRAVAAAAGTPFQWMRLFGTFGPGEPPHRLLPAIVDKLSRGESVALSPGDQVRDLLFVEDVVEGLIAAAHAGVDGVGGLFNLCSGKSISVKEMASQIADALGKPRTLLRFGAIDYRPNETLWQVGRADRFRALTGFVPRVSIREGIDQSISASGMNEGVAKEIG